MAHRFGQYILFLTILIPVISAYSAEDKPEVYLQHPRVFAVNYNPVFPSLENRSMHQVGGWNDPVKQNRLYITDMAEASNGIVNYRLSKEVTVPFFQVKIDGFRYTTADADTPGSYLHAQKNNAWHRPDGADYRAVIRDFDLARRCDRGEIDEVFMQGAPYFGYYESQMAGRGSYWCNSPGLPDVAGAKIFVIMGFNYERGIAEMVHDYGHRAESIMSRVYGGWDIKKKRNDWERFTRNQGQSGDAACGTCHWPPNAENDYDYANKRFVDSTAIDWRENYPKLTGKTSPVNCETWGGPDHQLNYLKWWFMHMPHVAGTNNHDGIERLNNWWAYLQDFNHYPESGGQITGSPQKLDRGPFARRITDTGRDNFAPQVNSSGIIVWSGSDGENFHIYSASVRGSQIVQVSKEPGIHEAPRINSRGRIVWQAYIQGRYEIFSANADGSGLTRITNNNTFDWHPEINDAGRIVWDSFDGNDYEIFSANADGTDIRQITRNHAESGKPKDDVWAQINNAGRIVWMGFDGNDWEIYSANADGTDIVQITDNNYDDEYPRINDAGTITWHASAGGKTREIFTAKSDGSNVKRITNNNTEDWYPVINNEGKVAWMGHDGSNWQIFYWTEREGVVKVTDNSVQDIHPSIDAGGRIVWQGYDGSDWEIFGMADGKIYQITDNGYDDRAPAITANAGIIWHADAGEKGSSDIFIAPNVYR